MRKAKSSELRERCEEVGYGAGESVPLQIQDGEVLELLYTDRHRPGEKIAGKFELTQPSQAGYRTRYPARKPVPSKAKRIKLGHGTNIYGYRTRELIIFDIDELEIWQAEKRFRERTRNIPEIMEVNSNQVMEFRERRGECTGQEAIGLVGLPVKLEGGDPFVLAAGDAGPGAAVGAGSPGCEHSRGVRRNGRLETQQTRLIVLVA